MIKQEVNQYFPDVVSPPGETLAELLEERGMTQAELAQRTGRPTKTINEIIQGKAAITPETALQLERVLGVPASFWNERERLYRESLARCAEQERLHAYIPWLNEIPVRAMIDNGWIEPYEHKWLQVEAVLRFFGVVSPNEWQNIWQRPDAAFRKSPAFTSKPGAVAAWLRKGELQAQHIVCAPYQEQAFRAALVDIRRLTVEPPELFLLRLTEQCAQCGVAVVFVPELPGTRVCGATRWLTPSKALIQLSLRYRTDDHLWFTFFHEAGHILFHGKRQVFLEEDDAEQRQEENEANHFAADCLIPPKKLQHFLATHNYRSKAEIIAFAAELEIAPGIVVGRLQHDGYIPHRNCNDLKRRLEWGRMHP